MKDLTLIQKHLLEFLRKNIDEGMPTPTYRELCRQFGWTSTATARDHLRALAKKGYIHLSGGLARSLSMAHPSNKLLLEFSFPSRSNNNKEDGGFQILKNDQTCYAVQVANSCLRTYGVEKGDLAIINTERDCSSGDIVFMELERKRLFRKFQIEAGRAGFYNPVTERLRYFPSSRVHIIGVVIGFIKFCSIESISM
jgi:SOS-response transcriptional repressor LexA